MLRKIRRAWEHQPHDIRGPSDDWVKRGLIALFDTRNAIEVMAGNRASAISSALMGSAGGLAADFSGTANQQYAHRAAYATTGAMSLLILCDVDALSGYGALIAKQASSTTYAPYELRLGASSTDSRINFLRAYSSSYSQVTPSGSNLVAAGSKLVRIVLACGEGFGPAGAVWVNGSKTTFAATSGIPAEDNGASVWIGRRSDGATQLDGRIYHIGLLNRAATDADAAEFTERPFSLFEPRRIWVPVSAGGSSLDLTETTAVALSGSVSVSGDIQIGTNFNLTQSSAVGLAGSLATTGDVQIGTTFNLAQTADVGLAGSVGVSGDIQILSGSLDLTQTSTVAMSGTVGLSGDIQIGTSFDLAQTAAVGLTGSVATTGDIQIGTDFNLTQSVALAMSGSVAVTGDFQSGTAPVVTQAYGNFGWDPRIRLSWKRKELREELEAALDDAPKAVRELVRIPGPDISEAPVREALEVVRTARKHRERAVTRQEIDELHEALETVATFTREREATRQARRRKQQHLLLLS